MNKSKIQQELKSRGVDLTNLDHWSMSIEGFKWILENISLGSSILEIGAGRGTIELSKFYNVITVEDKIEWVGAVDKVEYIHAPLSQNGWYSVSNLKKSIPNKYDLLIVDGPEGSPNRTPILDNLDLFYLKCPILVDDVHAKASLHIAEQLASKLNRHLKVHKGWQKQFATIV